MQTAVIQIGTRATCGSNTAACARSSAVRLARGIRYCSLLKYLSRHGHEAIEPLLATKLGERSQTEALMLSAERRLNLGAWQD